jgi:CHASE1-domain containing sensor protein
MKLRAFRSMAGWVDGHRIAVVLAALLVGLAITFASYQSVRSKEAEAARLRFDRIVSDTARDIGEAMKQYERLLQAASSHLYSRGGIERGDWKKFAEHLQLQDRYPGLLGLGYTPAIPGNYLEQHIQAIRAEGFPSYTVIPSGVRDLHTPVAYLEPFYVF